MPPSERREVKVALAQVARSGLVSVLRWSVIKSDSNSLDVLIETALLFHLNCVLFCLASERIMISASPHGVLTATSLYAW